jgi:hypothetical protein
MKNEYKTYRIAKFGESYFLTEISYDSEGNASSPSGFSLWLGDTSDEAKETLEALQKDLDNEDEIIQH